MMFLFKLGSFLFGFVTILIKGNNIEKLLNMAASRGIYLWDIKRVEEDEVFLKVRLSAVKPLRHIGRKTNCRFSFKEREGLPFLFTKIKKRKSLVLGLMVFLAGLYVLSSFIWFVDVKGNRKLAPEIIIKVAAEAGLKPGTTKFTVNQEKVENLIRDRIPEVSYVGVNINGTRATIEIAEKIIIKKPQERPADIISKKSGLIKEVLVLVGNPMVKEGDTVVPGQVLISGTIPPPEQSGTTDGPEGIQEEQIPSEPPTYVQARGVVRARVWYEGYAEVPLVEEGEGETGNSFSKVCMKIGGREIILSGKKKMPFVSYRMERSVKKPPIWRNLSIPVELVTEKYYEIKKYRKQHSRQEATELARVKALGLAKAGIGTKARIVESQTREIVSKNPDNLIRFKAYIETLEDIGLEKSQDQP